MDLLRSHKLPFGISCCWTRANADTVATEENIDWMIDKGALFCWYFHFMPVGRAATAELIPTPEQREKMYRFVREMREKKPLFTLDFQNDGEYVGGCIAGGRRYLHINAAGDVEPCVFIHYSNVNIHDVSLLDALGSPIFMKYYEGQPFNANHLKPCPMLENPDTLPKLVAESGAHSTDLVEKETPEQLREKTVEAAKAWAPVADRLWDQKREPPVREAPCGRSLAGYGRYGHEEVQGPGPLWLYRGTHGHEVSSTAWSLPHSGALGTRFAYADRAPLLELTKGQSLCQLPLLKRVEFTAQSTSRGLGTVRGWVCLRSRRRRVIPLYEGVSLCTVSVRCRRGWRQKKKGDL